MREIRTSGSEGGGPKSIGSPYPYHHLRIEPFCEEEWIAGSSPAMTPNWIDPIGISSSARRGRGAAFLIRESAAYRVRPAR